MGIPIFRPYQEQVIQEIIQKKDTLAILPTGAGKSLIYQVAGLYFDQPTLVISPLLALMKDQASQLNAKNIKAVAFDQNITNKDWTQTFDNIKHGGVKFVFCSPEKIQSKEFQQYLNSIEWGLFVVDEAHCISAWGHDFRPAFLEIAQIRLLFPHTPVLG